MQASLHSLQAGFKLKLSIKQPKKRDFDKTDKVVVHSLHSWSQTTICTFSHYTDSQFHFCHVKTLLSLQRLCERCNQEGEHQHGRGLKLSNRQCQLYSEKAIHFQVDKRVLGTAEEKQAMPEETQKEEKS